MKVFVRLGLLWMVLIFSINFSTAQDILRGRDLSKINVDVLTDEEIISYRDQLKSSGLSETQAEQIAIQRGMPSSEIVKLKARLAKLENFVKLTAPAKPSARTTDTSLNRRIDDTLLLGSKTVSTPTVSKIFGSELFANTSMTFEPNIRIATPKNYMLGADDELLIDVYGYQEVNYKLTISPEGSITIPYVGAIPVAGSSIEQATKRIRERMIRNGYASLGSGQSKLEVNVGKIKSIKVTIVGEARRPGTYTLSSLASIFNALYAAGGINDRGSFRMIELIRNNTVVSRLDAYDFLLKGDLSKNSGLVDQDVIRIPLAELQVEVVGEVKRPGTFEMLAGENMKDLLRFTGGFTNEAYTAALHVRQLNEKERQLKDVTTDQYSSYTPSRGDVVVVDKILETFTNRVTINGAVLRPGQFELTPGLTLAQLINRADGLRQDAFTNRALLVRTKENLTTEIIPFQVNEVLSSPGYDIKLQREDVVTIASLFDYKENYTVTIEGEVRKPGVFKFIENLTLKDLLFQAGGLTDAAAPQQIEIARRLNNDTLTSTQQIAEVLDVNSERDLLVKGAEIKLTPWDIVIVRTKVSYRPQITVRMEGEVLYPGTYVLSSKQDRISDLVTRAGGLTPDAFMQGAYLSRRNLSGVAKEANITRIQKIQQEVKDTSNTILADVTNPVVKVGLDLEKILASPRANEDIVLQEGDILTVSKKTYEVMINGEVMFPTQVVFKEGADLTYYIDKAGGFTDNARKKRTYVLYANGSAGKTKKFLFFKSYPSVKPGAEILIPKVSDRSKQRMSTTEILGLTSAFATLLTIVITLARL
jgi:protein involved in polysaccharide export with SLBB domain